MSVINRFVKLDISISRIKAHTWRAFLFFLVALASALVTFTVVRAAVVISATKTDAIIGDDGDGKADPGETIEYTVVIPNSGSTDAANVTFTDVIDANTTLVGGSINISPLAINDNYETIGNTLLEVGVAAGSDPAVRVSGNLFDNDVEFLTDAGTFIMLSYTNPTNGTLVAFNNGTGTFSYLPNPNFIGTDTFTYTLQDTGGLTDTATVTINVTQRVWYVKNNATGGGFGRSTDPFDTLVEAQTASSVNDTIYIFTGNGTTSGQNTGITLKSGQRLLGEGVALTVPVSVNGGANPTTLRAAGSMPLIDHTAGNGVSVSDISNVEIRGLNIAGSVNGVDVTTTAANSGSFELANNIIRSAGIEGVDVNGGGSGTLAVNIHDNTITATGNGIDIQRTAGSVNVTAFDDNVVTGNTGGIGINIVGTGATILFDAVSGGSFDTVLGGTTAIGQSGNAVGAAGLVLDNVRGDLSFTDLDIYADNGNALFVDGTTSNYTGSSGVRITANTGTPTLNATNGAAANITQANINLVLNSLTSTNSTGTGVSLAETSGTFTAPSGSSITNASGADFSVNAGGGSQATSNVVVTYGGTITDDLGTLVQIQNVTAAATYAFSGAITDGNDGDGSGISLTNNSGATITFSGGLLLSTSSNAAFTATGGGTVSVCDENPCNPGATGALVNTLTTTTGTALNIANTNIGSNKLEFRSINVDGDDSLPVNGIVLNNTGSVGGLIVKGTGSAGSGGTLQDTSGDAALLTSTQNASFSYMNFTSNLGSGIRGTSMNGFVLNNISVTNNGDQVAVDESGIELIDLIGTASGGSNPTSITNSTISNNYEFELQITNSSGTLTDLQMSGNTISSNGATAQHGNLFNFLALGTANMKLSLTSGTFTGAAPATATGVQCDHSGIGGTLTCNISGATFTNNNVAVSVSQAQGGNLKFTVSGNTATGNRSHGLNLFVNANTTGTTDGNFLNNIVGTLNTAGSGSNLGFGIRVQNEGINTTNATNVLISGNTVQEMTNFAGINVNQGVATQASSRSTNVTITNNTVREVDNSRAIIIQQNNTTSPGFTCTDISGNLFSNVAGNIGDGTEIRLRQLAGGTFNVRQIDLANLASVNSILTTDISTSGTITYNAGPCIQPVAMSPGSDQVLAQIQPETSPMVGAQVESLNSENTFAATSGSVNAFAAASAPVISRQAFWGNLFNASTIGSGKPLFSVSQPLPAQTGDTINVTIGSLPAGESVTIKFQVTVDNPLPPGVTQISNQGTVNYDPAQSTLTDDTAVGGVSDPTITLVDRPDTTVSSINRSSSTPTNASSISWTVTFANAVNGLANSNFTLVNGGLGGAPSITGLTAVGGAPAAQWTVTASTGTGDGTLGLNLSNDTGLSHDVTNSPFTGQVYTIDRTPPSVTSFTLKTPASSPTNADTLVFLATFSESVTGVDTADFSVNSTSTATVTAVVQVTPSTYDVTISGGDLAGFDGTVNLDLSGTQNITDLAGNALPAGEPATDETYLVDNSAPSVTSFTLKAPASSPTNVDALIFLATFSEDVTGVDAADFAVNSASTATVTTVVQVTPSTYDVFILGGDLAGFNGTVNLDLSGTPTIVDQINNALPAGEPSTDETYTLDNSAPSVISFTLKAPASSPTNVDALIFLATFSESVTGVDAADFAVNSTSTATVATVMQVTPSTYDVTISGGDLAGFDGTVNLDLSGTPTINDLAGNPPFISEPSTDETYLVDNSAPSVTSFTLKAPASSPTNVDALIFLATFSEDVAGVDAADFAVNSTSTATVTAVVQVTPSTYDVTISGGDLAGFNGTVNLDLSGTPTITDLAGNPPFISEPSTDETYTLENSAPSVTSFTLKAPASSPTNADTLVFLATFSESVTGVDTADFSVNSTSTATVTVVVQVTPSTYDVTISGGDLAGFDGTVNLDLSGTPTITDLAGNPPFIGEPSTDETYTLENSAPSVTSFTLKTPASSPTNADTLVFLATFSESVTGVDAADFAVNSTSTATVTTVVQVTPSTYDVTISGGDLAGFNGTVNLDLSGTPTIVDQISNALPAGEPSTDETYLVDNSALTVAGSSLVASYTTGPGSFTVTFSEDVFNPAGNTDPDDVTNPANYLLVEDGANAAFNTGSCAGGLVVDDTQVTVNSVTYIPNTAIVNLGSALPAGNYRLFICGTTSIVDLANNVLAGDGATPGTDAVFNFIVTPATTPPGAGNEETTSAPSLPDTGFAPNKVTSLPVQPANLRYTDLGSMWVEIPSQNIKSAIVGVPKTDKGWDTTWLANNTGWLNGTAFPTWEGNSVLTAHVTNSNGLPGPFANIKNLKYGDQIIVNLSGQQYIYEVRNTRLSRPTSTSFALADLEDYSYLTLITCQGYNPLSNSYFFRRIVRAVLVSVK